MSIRSVSAPIGCALSNLDYSATTFTGSLVVPPQGTNSVAVPISLIETHTNQNSCEDKRFDFTFVGLTRFSETYATATAIDSSLNPSQVGQSVTYTASVTASAAAGQDPVPSSPTGALTFKDGATTICASVPVISSGTTTATAQCSPPAYLVGGTHPITAVYSNADGNFSASVSPVLNQVVQSTTKPTSTELASAPNPSASGSQVALTADVSKNSGSGTPSGIANFYLGIPSGTHVLLDTGSVNSNGKATLLVTTLPVGADNLYAVYQGDSHFSTSTSPVIVQMVINVPPGCSSHLGNVFFGTPTSPNIRGTNDEDFISAFGANYSIDSRNGDDCIVVGDGNNGIAGGNGDDVVVTGNGNNRISLGNGDDRVTTGNGSNSISVGNGDDAVTVGNGSNSNVIVGNGSDVVILGSGSNNTVSLGNGNDVVTIQGGSHDVINGGVGNSKSDDDRDGHGAGNVHETIYLGSGSYNTFHGQANHTNACHLPAPPSTLHGPVAAYYHDAVTNCTVVTP
jgi:Ca2+-binding RTX toxin-like protein